MPGPITEPENCSAVIGEVDFNLCNPKTGSGQVGRVFVTLLDGNEDFGAYNDNPDTAGAVNNPAAWTERMDQTGASQGAIITLHGIGEKPEPEDQEIELPLGQTKVLERVHTLPLTVYQISDPINMLMRRWAAYGGTVGIWYETRQPRLKGSGADIRKPIRASVKAAPVVARDVAGGDLWNVTFSWKDVNAEDSIDSPVPSTPTLGSGS